MAQQICLTLYRIILYIHKRKLTFVLTNLKYYYYVY